MRWYKDHVYNKGNNKLSNWMETEPTTQGGGEILDLILEAELFQP